MFRNCRKVIKVMLCKSRIGRRFVSLVAFLGSGNRFETSTRKDSFFNNETTRISTFLAIN